MKELAKLNETEKSEQNYIYSAKDIWELSNSSSRSWDRFVTEFLFAIDGEQKKDYLEEHASRNGGNKYTEKTLKAFQAWLMKNQANQGRASATIKEATTQAVENKNWTSKKELMNNLQISSDTIEQIISDLTCRRPADTQTHIKKGGYHNSEVFYDDYLVNMITAELAKHNTNQNTGIIQKQMNTEAKEQGILLNAVANSGDLKAAQALCDLIMEKTKIQAENKRLLEQTKQMEHALNYTAVIGWKKWSDLKKELAQSFEIFQHRISFKTVAAEAGLVKETDYAERIYGEDCFPTTMISESGIDKIYNCYDR